MKKRIGFIGGTFDPVHNGHIRVAIEVKEVINLDWVEFIPAPKPPHKLNKKILDFEKRVYFLAKSIEGIEFLKINTIEAKRKGPSYTFFTLLELNKIYPDSELFFIIGCDEVTHLHNWYRWRELFELASFVVVGREGYLVDNLQYFIEKKYGIVEKKDEFSWSIGKNKIYYLEIPHLDISSSLIKKKILDKKSIKGLVSDIIIEELVNSYVKFFKEEG